jgi:hypothetical protein
MADTKRQHYVPRLLLKHFCPDEQTIYATNLKTNKSFFANIMKIAQEKYFYDLNTDKGKVSLEKQFADLEDKTAPIIDKIVKTESIAWLEDQDKRIIEDFILCQFYRTRQYVNRVKKFLQTNDVPLFDVVGADGNVRKQIFSKDIEIDDNVAKIIGHNFLSDIEHDQAVRDAIASMEWLLVKSPDGITFITSDNPSVLNNEKADLEKRQDSTGFDLPHSQIFLPISSKLMLTLTAKPMTEEARTSLLKILIRGINAIISDAFRCSVTGEAFLCSGRLVKVCNEAQKRNAERFVFGGEVV